MTPISFAMVLFALLVFIVLFASGLFNQKALDEANGVVN